MKEKDSRPLVETLWQLSKAVRYEVNDPDNNLDKAKAHLKQGSLLLYTNHFSTLDTTVLARFLDENLSISNLSILAGRKHLDPQRGVSSRIKNSVIHGLAKTRGFDVLQVVQRYEAHLYQDSSNFNRVSVQKAIEALKTKGRILAIAPEGTRSKTDGLIKAEPGIDILFRIAKDSSLALPIALHPYQIFPPLTQTVVEVGTPYSYEEISMEKVLYPDKSIINLMMGRLAVLLPKENRGYYAKSVTS